MDQERRVGIVRKTMSLTWGQGEGEEGLREKSGRVWSLCPPYSTLSLLLLPSLHKEETEFQPSQGGAGGRARTLASSAAPWGCRPTTTPAGRAPRPSYCLLPEGQPEHLRGARKHPGDHKTGGLEDEGEEAFKSAALYGRSGYHSAPQMLLSSTPWCSHQDPQHPPVSPVSTTLSKTRAHSL